MTGGIVLNGNRLTIVDSSRLKASQRAIVQSMDAEQPLEGAEGRPVVKSWKLSGPMGKSRQRFFGDQLQCDYTDNLDHRYEGLLTSTAKRNAVTLTALTNVQYGVPISDVTKTNWSEGAGDANANAFEELDEGIDSGTPDDATTYWTTTSTGLANRIQCNITSLSDPGVDTGHRMKFRYRNQGSADTQARFLLSQGGSTLLAHTFIMGATGSWLTADLAISESVVGNITDYTDLELGVYINSATTASLDLSAMELETPATKAGDVITIDNQFGYVFANRGAYSTQIESGGMTEIENNDRTNIITDTVPEWQNEGIVAYGSAKNLDKRTAATDSGATYGTIAGTDATKMAVLGRHLWLLDAGKNTAADKGKAKYTEESAALTAASLSNGFFIGDPNATYTGLYPSGPHMMAGFDRGVSSFTQSGKEVPLVTAVKKFPSSANGAAGDEGFEGWTYVGTKLGLYAVSVAGKVANPVGPGEGLDGQNFEGPVDGYPTAIEYFKDTLWVAYLNPDGTTYIFRGQFGPETAQTGRPEWYMFRKLSALECHAFGAVERTNPTLIVGEDENIAYYTLSTRGREIADSNYEFDTGGGTWFGTTFMLPVGLVGNVRWAKFLAENTGVSDTWQLAVSPDEGAYVNVGSAVATDGMATVRPVTSGVPDGTSSFTTLKPRLTQVASSETAPPQIRGDLTIAYDERPEQIRDISVLVEINGDDLATIEALVDAGQKTPVTFRNPFDTTVNPNETDGNSRYAYVVSAVVEDLKGPNDQGLRLRIKEWVTS